MSFTASEPGVPDLRTALLADRLAAFLDARREYYTYKDLLTDVFDEDEDRFLDAFCDGTLPRAVRQLCQETMGDALLQTWLLRRMVRLQVDVLRVLRVLNDQPVSP